MLGPRHDMKVDVLHPDPGEALLLVERLQGLDKRVRLALREAGKVEVSGTLELDGIDDLTDALRTQPGSREVWRALEGELKDRPTSGWRRVILAVDPGHDAASLRWEGLRIHGEPVFLDARCELVRTWPTRVASRPALVRSEDAGALRVLVLLGDVAQQWAQGAPDHALTSVTADSVRATVRAVCETLAGLAPHVGAMLLAPGWDGSGFAIGVRTADSIAEIREWLRGERDASEGFDAVAFVGHSNAVYDWSTRRWTKPATALRFRIAGADVNRELSFTDLETDLLRTRTRVLMLHSCWTPPPALRALGDAVGHVIAWAAPIDPVSCGIATEHVFKRLGTAPPGRLGDALRLARTHLGAPKADLLLHFAGDPHAEVFVDVEASDFAAFRETARTELLRLPEALEGYADGAQVLQELYVELDVEPGRDRASAAAMFLRGSTGPRPLSAWIGDPALAPRFVLCGEPGSGKSTLLRHLAVQLLERGWIAVYATIQSILDEGVTALTELGRTRAFLDEKRIARALASGRFALLLDGLDEVGDRSAAEKRISLLASQLGGGCMVVASRTDGLRAFDDRFTVARVCELDDAGQERLVRNWFRVLHEKPAERGRWGWLAAQGRGSADHVEAATRAVVEEFGRRRPLAIVCRSPLALTLCILRVAEQGLAGLPASRYGILGWLAGVLLGNEHRADRPFHEVVTPRRLLGQLALFMLERGVVQCELAGADLRWSGIGRDFAVGLSEGLREWEGAGDPRSWRFTRAKSGEARTLLDRLRVSGAIEPADPHSPLKLRFPIQSLADFLAADALRERFEADLPRLLAWLEERKERIAANLGRWSETLALCASWQGDRATAWLLSLARLDLRLGLRALGRADNPPIQVVNEILGAGDAMDKTTFWDNFARTFGIETREDAERAMGLLEQAGSCLESGIDRCLIEEEAVLLEAQYRVSPLPVRTRVRGFGLERVAEVHLFAEQPSSGEGLWKRLDYHEGKRDLPFWVMAVPVTIGMYRMFDSQHTHYWRMTRQHVADAKAYDEWHEDNTTLTVAHPVAVRWTEAVGFCRWLNQLWACYGSVLGSQRQRRDFATMIADGWRFRLPTEREWEWACSGGSEADYSCGAALSREVAWFGKGVEGATYPVGLLRPNIFGLRDMHGNIWEWCANTWNDERGVSGAARDRRAARVLKGGSFWDEAITCGTRYRERYEPVFRFFMFGNDFGFRVVLGPPLARDRGCIEDR